MNEFSNKINVKNIDNFPKLLFELNLKYLRKAITENILLGNEENYFDLEKFKNEFKQSFDDILSMIEIINTELDILGWNTKLAYGKTALFIYSTQDSPSNCYDDDF